MLGAKMLTAVLMAGSLAVGSGLALAATTDTKASEALKTPAISQAVAPAVEKAGKETKGTQQAEKARAAQEGKEKEKAPDRTVRGQVASVDVAAKTITVNVMRDKVTETVGVEVPDTAKITAGKATKPLADLKVGDQVRLTYDRLTDKLVADQIHILKAAPAAAKSESPKKSS
ncbi:MAG TPA: hypothetical protein VF579_14785 [Candidatus Methylomirabilis sp.]